jgi:hypothetical protein
MVCAVLLSFLVEHKEFILVGHQKNELAAIAIE